MTNPRRNLLCSCGSGRKYKHCCGARDRRPPEDGARALVQGFPLLRAKLAREADRVAKHGEGRPPIHAEHDGVKYVAVGSRVHYSKDWVTFADFLRDFVFWQFGEDWFNVEIKRAPSERHPVIAHRWGDSEAMKKEAPGRDGLYSVNPSGHALALLTLAYDLYEVKHNGAFHDDVVRRLRYRDQYAGARYELFAAATCVRAGMAISHEDERDGSRRHSEFWATHSGLGITMAVEAKQRQRTAAVATPGVVRPGLTSLVNDAMGKKPGMPFVVFADLDVDPPPADSAAWVGRMESALEKEMRAVETQAGGVVPANMILATNIAYSRAREAPGAPTLLYQHIPDRVLYPLPDHELLNLLFLAAGKHKNIPHIILGKQDD